MTQGDKKTAQTQAKTNKNTKKVEGDDTKVDNAVESKDELLVSQLVIPIIKTSNGNFCQEASVSSTLRQRQALEGLNRANAAVDRANHLRTMAVEELGKAQATAPWQTAAGARRPPLGREKLGTIPGVNNVSQSGKRMRRLPTYYLKKEEEILADIGDEQYVSLIKKMKMDDSSVPVPVKTETG